MKKVRFTIRGEGGVFTRAHGTSPREDSELYEVGMMQLQRECLQIVTRTYIYLGQSGF